MEEPRTEHTVVPAAVLIWWLLDKDGDDYYGSFFTSQEKAEEARKACKKRGLRIEAQARLTWEVTPHPKGDGGFHFWKPGAEAVADRANLGMSLDWHDHAGRSFFPCEVCGHDWGLHGEDGTCPPRTTKYLRHNETHEHRVKLTTHRGYEGPMPYVDTTAPHPSVAGRT